MPRPRLLRAAGDRVALTIRLPLGLLREIEHLAIDAETDRARMVEALLRLGLEHRRAHQRAQLEEGPR